MATSVSQYGFTWTFSADHTVGQFANTTGNDDGDYWVVGPVTITGITPASTLSGGRTINGSMVNPGAGITEPQGFDSAMAANIWNSALNVARPGGSDLSAGNPLVLNPGDSLISTISHATPGFRPQLTDAAVLTVVASPPASGSLRPSYSDADKTIYNISDIDWNQIRNLAHVGSTPTISSLLTGTPQATLNGRMWMMVQTNTGEREMHPSNNQEDYGEFMCDVQNKVWLRLELNDSQANKLPLLVRALQYGIDIYGAAQAGGNWRTNGGFNMGRLFPMVKTGYILGVQGMKDYGNRSLYNRFQEFQNTFYVSATEVTYTNTSSAWNPDNRGDYAYGTISVGTPAVYTATNHGFVENCKIEFLSTGGSTAPTGVTLGNFYYVLATDLTADTFKFASSRGGTPINTTAPGTGQMKVQGVFPYTDAYLGLPEWGIEHQYEPDKDNASLTASYRSQNKGPGLGQVMIGHLTDGMMAGLNWDPVWEYMDRVYADNPTSSAYTPFVKNMYDAYRNYAPGSPEPLSATINATGTTLTIVWSEDVVNGADGADDLTVSLEVATTATYSLGTGTATYVYDLSPAVFVGSAVTYSYTQPGDGIKAEDDGAVVQTFADLTVTNNSTLVNYATMSNGSRQRLFPRTGGGF
jgi:hypothetical protein